MSGAYLGDKEQTKMEAHMNESCNCQNYKPITKPTPGQPCPACGRAVPDPIPPAPRKDAAQENPPFKVGDWVSRYNVRTIARPVSSIACIDGKWMLRFPFDDFPYDANNYRHIFPAPALPPLPEDVLIWAEWALQKASASPTMYVDGIAVARFLRSLYPNELKD
jgi:hypothetical protein